MVFRDTAKLCHNDPKLIESVKNTIKKVENEDYFLKDNIAKKILESVFE